MICAHKCQHENSISGHSSNHVSMTRVCQVQAFDTEVLMADLKRSSARMLSDEVEHRLPMRTQVQVVSQTHSVFTCCEFFTEFSSDCDAVGVHASRLRQAVNQAVAISRICLPSQIASTVELDDALHTFESLQACPFHLCPMWVHATGTRKAISHVGLVCLPQYLSRLSSPKWTQRALIIGMT